MLYSFIVKRLNKVSNFILPFKYVPVLFYSESFLQFKGHTPPPRLASLLMFLSELLRRNNDSEPALLTLPLPALLRCLMMVNDPHGAIMLLHLHPPTFINIFNILRLLNCGFLHSM